MASNSISSHLDHCANVYKLGTSILGNPFGAKLVDPGIVVLGPVRCFRSKCNITPGTMTHVREQSACVPVLIKAKQHASRELCDTSGKKALGCFV
jgi:hypothetical protein